MDIPVLNFSGNERVKSETAAASAAAPGVAGIANATSTAFLIPGDSYRGKVIFVLWNYLSSG